MRKPRSRRADYEWLLPQPVRWRDMDALGHVNNATYLTYAETARIAYFDELFAGDETFMNGQGPILAEQTCTYHEQLSYPDSLELGVRLERIGNSSFVVNCPVFRVGQELAVADASILLAWFDYREQKTIPVPELLRNAFARQKPLKETS